MYSTFVLSLAALVFGMGGVHAQATGTTLTVTPEATAQSPSSSFDSQSFNSVTVTNTDTSAVESFTTTVVTLPITESSFPPTFTSCFITPTGSYPMTTEVLDPQASDLPEGAECFLIIRESGSIEENLLYTVDASGVTVSFDSLGVAHTLSATPSPVSSASSSSSSKHTGAIVGAVIGSVFGTAFVGATLIWIRRQRRSTRASGTWFNRQAGWVQDEKSGSQIEMTRRAAA